MVHTRRSTIAQPCMAATHSANVSIFFALNSNNQSYSYVVCCGWVHMVMILSLCNIFVFCQMYAHAWIPKMSIVPKAITTHTTHNVTNETLFVSPLCSLHFSSVSTPDTDVTVPLLPRYVAEKARIYGSKLVTHKMQLVPIVSRHWPKMEDTWMTKSFVLSSGLLVWGPISLRS